MPKMHWNIDCKLEDFWVGAYWDNDKTYGWLQIYVCIIPCFPICLSIRMRS
jgi:hypothetical protein